eukprot:TRINITY_DN20553_c0_g1_i1.p1 TRINITY_DN20553_c0_g1~~TRINITY_DN20553_c0_g1_i1.p1  ORF type:complete len:288 (+),score=48.11 TRINITY_DN20553_c0_g1_i1:74-865(+)
MALNGVPSESLAVPRELVDEADAAGFDRMVRSLDDAHFRATLRAFVKCNCLAFAENEPTEHAAGAGYNHLCHQLFCEYKRLFDEQVTGFLASEDVACEDFIAYARALSQAPAHRRVGWETFLTDMTKSESFDKFAECMREAASRQRVETDEAARSIELPEVLQSPAAAGAAEAAASAALAAEAAATARPPSVYYFVAVDGQQHGPVTADIMRSCWSSGHLTLQSYVWGGGLAGGGWALLSDLPTLQSELWPKEGVDSDARTSG